MWNINTTISNNLTTSLLITFKYLHFFDLLRSIRKSCMIITWYNCTNVTVTNYPFLLSWSIVELWYMYSMKIIINGLIKQNNHKNKQQKERAKHTLTCFLYFQTYRVNDDSHKSWWTILNRRRHNKWP